MPRRNKTLMAAAQNAEILRICLQNVYSKNISISVIFFWGVFIWWLHGGYVKVID